MKLNKIVYNAKRIRTIMFRLVTTRFSDTFDSIYRILGATKYFVSSFQVTELIVSHSGFFVSS